MTLVQLAQYGEFRLMGFNFREGKVWYENIVNLLTQAQAIALKNDIMEYLEQLGYDTNYISAGEPSHGHARLPHDRAIFHISIDPPAGIELEYGGFRKRFDKEPVTESDYTKLIALADAVEEVLRNYKTTDEDQ